MLRPTPLHSGCPWFTRSADILRRSDFADVEEIPEPFTPDQARDAHNELLRRLKFPRPVVTAFLLASFLCASLQGEVVKKRLGSIRSNEEVVIDVTGGGGGGGGVETNDVRNIVKEEVPAWARRVAPQVSDGVATTVWVEGKGYALSSDLPTKVSDLENDSGFVDKTITNGLASVSMLPTKVSDLENDAEFVDRTITNGLASVSMLPTKVSDLENDSEFVDKTVTNGLAAVSMLPTKVSDLENDSGFVDRTVTNGLVSAATLASTKVSAFENDAEYVTKSVTNGLASVSMLPTKVGDLENDAGYVTSAIIDGLATTGEVNAVASARYTKAEADAKFASRVSGAVNERLASLTSGGDLADSGYSAGDFLLLEGGEMNGDIGMGNHMIYDASYLGVTGAAEIDGDLSATGGLTVDGYVSFGEGMELTAAIDGKGTAELYGFTDAQFSGDVVADTVSSGNATMTADGDVLYDGTKSLKALYTTVLGKASRDNVSGFSPATSSTPTYGRWELRRQYDTGSEVLFMALRESSGVPVTDTTAWQQVRNASVPLSLFAKDLENVVLKASNPAFAAEVNGSVSATNEQFLAEVRKVVVETLKDSLKIVQKADGYHLVIDDGE